MINRIDGNQYNDYNAAKTVNSIKDSGEKFSLDYKNAYNGQNDLQSEETEEKDSVAGKERARTTEKNGVRLEISRDGQQAGERRRQDSGAVDKHSQATMPFLDTIQTFITGFMQTVKELINRIWNEPQSQDTVQSSDVSPEEAERYTEEYLALRGLKVPGQEATATETAAWEAETVQQTRNDFVDKDAEIQKYLHDGNLDRVISLLTDNGHKTIAKNSNLLTYYDRSGRITQINPSDRERILHGDRNTRKL